MRVYGEKGGVQWNQEFPETIKYTPLNMPEQTIVRGHGAGVVPAAERMVTLPRGHGESLSDAWGNLYREIAIAIDAHQSGTVISDDLLAVPTVETGVRGVQFMNAAADNHEGRQRVGLILKDRPFVSIFPKTGNVIGNCSLFDRVHFCQGCIGVI